MIIKEVDEKLWRTKREEAYKRFLEDLEIGYVDIDIKELIELVFTKKNIFTTSSCSGRITIVDAIYPWLREEASIVFKKHSSITVEEILSILNQNALHRFWLIVSGPIVHFNVLDLSTAFRLLTIVRNAGFKHSGILSISSGGIIVEVVSGVWVPFLLKDGDKIVVKDLEYIVSLVNEILYEGKAKLEKLFKFLRDADI
jgi:tRNA wybutosine-synthesizing protein 3